MLGLPNVKSEIHCNMKFCKIVLIVLLSIKSLKEILTTFTNLGDSDHPLEDILSSLIVITIGWGLYYGAGILDV